MLAHQREVVSKLRSGVSELRLMGVTKHCSMKVDALGNGSDSIFYRKFIVFPFFQFHFSPANLTRSFSCQPLNKQNEQKMLFSRYTKLCLYFRGLFSLFFPTRSICFLFFIVLPSQQFLFSFLSPTD